MTPEQALADIRAVRRDRSDSHWLDCAIVLADALEVVQDERAKLRADYNSTFSIMHGHERNAKFLRAENAKLRAERDSARRDAANVAGPLLDSIAKLHTELDAIKTEPDANPAPALAEVAT
jgi:hypothetical protein